MELLYRNNARRFTTGREAYQVRAPMFTLCGCGLNDLKWHKEKGIVRSHYHDAKRGDKKLPAVYFLRDNDFSRSTGVHCPIPMKIDSVWIVPSMFDTKR